MAQSLANAAWNDRIARISGIITLIGTVAGIFDVVGYYGGGVASQPASSLIQPPSLSATKPGSVPSGLPAMPAKPVNPDALVPSIGGHNPPPGSRADRWDDDDWGTVKRRQ
ncbi:MAG: hypothetical protein WCJ64_00610 [Rhodospirillaceae bacterium]